jgi:hypothetical protein
LPLSAEARFAEALAELPAVERSALALSEIGGLDADEIAERLGTDAVVVGKLLTRARKSVRASLEHGGRRGLGALIPFQNWWQSGSSGPAVRAAGAVAAAVVGTGVAIGGASADAPRQVLKTPDPPVARAFDPPRARPVTPARVAAVGVAAAGEAPVARPGRPSLPAQKPPPPAPPSSFAPHTVGAEPDLGARPDPAPPTVVSVPGPAAPVPAAPVPTITLELPQLPTLELPPLPVP